MSQDRRQNGFTLVEVLIVLGIAAILTAIAVPSYAAQRDKADQTVLIANTRTVYQSVASSVAQGELLTAYGPVATSDETARQAGATYVSNALEQSLAGGTNFRQPGNNVAGFVNPSSGKRTIENRPEIPTGPRLDPPAVWITDQEAGYTYEQFPAAGNDKTAVRLRGVIVACWDQPSGEVQIFYVDGQGRKSATVYLVPIH